MEEIYKMHAKTVYGFLLSRTNDPGLAEELTQETFYQAVESIERFRGECDVVTWLCAIAKNVWKTYLQKHKREIAMEPWNLEAARQRVETGTGGEPVSKSTRAVSKTGGSVGAGDRSAGAGGALASGATGISAEKAYFVRWDQMEVLKILHRMEEPYREVLYLRLSVNLSFKEIGEIMGGTENWARVTFYRGKEKIKKEMEGR